MHCKYIVGGHTHSTFAHSACFLLSLFRVKVSKFTYWQASVLQTPCKWYKKIISNYFLLICKTTFINVKIPMIDGILTFISRKNTTSESLEAISPFYLLLSNLLSNWNFLPRWVEHDLYGLWFNVPVNSYGHIEMISWPRHNFPGKAYRIKLLNSTQ